MNKLVKQAFTLIELLVVIAIIGILSGLIVVTMGGVTTKANIAKAQIFSNSLKNSLMMNLVSEWKFDELSSAVQGSTIQDIWSGSNNGTLNTNTDGLDKIRTGSVCVSGKCLFFDGLDDYINCGSGDNLNLTDAITIEAWVYPTAWSSHWSSILTKGTNWNSGAVFWLNYDGKIIFSIAGVHYSFNYIDLNKWTHLVITFSLSDQKIISYVDSVASSPQTRTTALPTQTPNLIGIHQTGTYPSGYGQFKGLMDNIRIYNIAISTSQIKEQYYAGLNSLLANGNINNEEYKQRLNSLAIK